LPETTWRVLLLFYLNIVDVGMRIALSNAKGATSDAVLKAGSGVLFLEKAFLFRSYVRN